MGKWHAASVAALTLAASTAARAQAPAETIVIVVTSGNDGTLLERVRGQVVERLRTSGHSVLTDADLEQRMRDHVSMPAPETVSTDAQRLADAASAILDLVAFQSN